MTQDEITEAAFRAIEIRLKHAYIVGPVCYYDIGALERAFRAGIEYRQLQLEGDATPSDLAAVFTRIAEEPLR